MTHPGGRPRSVDPFDLARALELRGAGLTWRQVGELVGLPARTVSKLAPRFPINSVHAAERSGTGSGASESRGGSET